MLPDRVSNPGPLTYESGALPIALRGPAIDEMTSWEELGGLYAYQSARTFFSDVPIMR